MKNHVSNYLFDKEKPLHKEIEYVNTTFRDTKLFIDPVLIEIGISDFCLNAKNQSLLNQYNKIVKEKYKSLMLSDETLDNILYN